MTLHTLGSIAPLGLGLLNLRGSLPHDPASMFVLVLSVGAIGAVVMANLPGKGKHK